MAEEAEVGCARPTGGPVGEPAEEAQEKTPQRRGIRAPWPPTASALR